MSVRKGYSSTSSLFTVLVDQHGEHTYVFLHKTGSDMPYRHQQFMWLTAWEGGLCKRNKFPPSMLLNLLALLDSYCSKSKNNIFKLTKGLIFLGTPHRGADLAELLKRVLEIGGIFPRKTVRKQFTSGKHLYQRSQLRFPIHPSRVDTNLLVL